uniref:Uncharacterized protein n=1 Tax=Glossina pallidipes TaxID=7398 RepID=A0A1B0ADS7_GLOPL
MLHEQFVCMHIDSVPLTQMLILFDYSPAKIRIATQGAEDRKTTVERRVHKETYVAIAAIVVAVIATFSAILS